MLLRMDVLQGWHGMGWVEGSFGLECTNEECRQTLNGDVDLIIFCLCLCDCAFVNFLIGREGKQLDIDVHCAVFSHAIPWTQNLIMTDFFIWILLIC